MDLRDNWGTNVPPNVHLATVPRCYDTVRVCTFCAQLFDADQTYRNSMTPIASRPRAPPEILKGTMTSVMYYCD